MNKNTNVWAALIGGPAESEAIQRIAFSFGYKWSNGLNCPYALKFPILLFDADTKTIRHSDDKVSLDKTVCEVCVSLVQAMKLFLSPPNNPKMKMKAVKTAKVFEDGSVLVGNSPVLYDFSSEDFEEVVKQRNQLMGKKRKLLLVGFVYDSPSSGRRDRRVTLIEDSVDSYAGLDVDDSNTFKRFRKDRILGHMRVIGLVDSVEV